MHFQALKINKWKNLKKQIEKKQKKSKEKKRKRDLREKNVSTVHSRFKKAWFKKESWFKKDFLRPNVRFKKDFFPKSRKIGTFWQF